MAAIKVLVVEDDQATAGELARILEKEMFEVMCAPNGDVALQQFTQQPADIIITDLKMPGMSGLDLMRVVKQRDPDVPVILVTGFGETEAAIEALRLGALDYFKKPVELDELLLAVGRAKERVVRRQRDSEFPTVLLAEDDEPTRTRLGEILRKEDWHVVLAHDGLHALEVFEANRVDVVLLDIKMPRMDGLRALAKMRSIRKDFAALILTGYGDENAAIEALRNGAMGFVRKPIDLEELLALLDKAREKLSLEQALRYRMRELDLAHQIIAQISEHGEIVVKLSELTLSDVKGRVRLALDSICECLWIIDDDDRVVFSNEPATQLLGERGESLDDDALEVVVQRSTATLSVAALRGGLERSRQAPIGGVEVFGLGGVCIKGRAQVGTQSSNYRVVIMKALDAKSAP